MFIFRTTRYDGTKGHFTFNCRCGSHDCVHVSYNGFVAHLGFYEGFYMCCSCGTSLDSSGHELCYYSDEFVFVPEPFQIQKKIHIQIVNDGHFSIINNG